MPAEWVTVGRADRRQITLYLHGGAYMMGSPRTHRTITSSLARATGGRVLVPDNRLAPEHPCPAAVEDALAAYASLLRAGYEPERIAFAGESAGGGLCFALLHLAAQRGYPMPGCVIAYSPWVDLTQTAESYQRNAKRDVMLPGERGHETADYYLGAMDTRDPLASPLFGTFDAPPPALIFGSRAEVLEDDASAMAARLKDAGGKAEIIWSEDAPHAWPFFAPMIPESSAAIRTSAEFIARHTA